MQTSQNLWFKNKKFGWGWTPSNAKGWAVLAVYLIVILAYPLASKSMPFEFSIGNYLAITGVATLILVGFCFMKGEKPSWHWGN